MATKLGHYFGDPVEQRQRSYSMKKWKSLKPRAYPLSIISIVSRRELGLEPIQLTLDMAMILLISWNY
jgi:hypothetical protein